MTIDEIKELILVVHDTGIAELEVQRGDNRVRIRRTLVTNQDVVIAPGVPPAAAGGPVSSSAAVSTPAATAAPGVEPPASKESERDVVVKSPIVGTYYDAPSAGSPPFVRIGDRVEAKQVLCIIESMKLMNEIEAEMSGTVVAKHVENGRAVEYGESLFTIRPL